MKKLTLLFVLILATITVSTAQVKSIIGTWKPVALNIEGLVSVDIKKGIVSPDAMFNGPGMAEAKKMLEANFDNMMSELKATTDAFTAKGKHIEYNEIKKETKESDYTYDASNNTLTMMAGLDEEEKLTDFKVEFTENGFKITGELDNPMNPSMKMRIMVEYEKYVPTK